MQISKGTAIAVIAAVVVVAAAVGFFLLNRGGGVLMNAEMRQKRDAYMQSQDASPGGNRPAGWADRGRQGGYPGGYPRGGYPPAGR
jgi:hypothetical protein